MQIIIVGCGKVGVYLTRQLVEEGHNVTVIDVDDENVKRVAVSYDVMGITGNGASYNILKEADIEHADVLIAVTYSDEINLLCCVIARTANCRTIARVRNPIYSQERELFQREMGISLIINPQRSAAREIRRLIQFPSALEVDGFARGKVDLITFKVPKESVLVGKALKELSVSKEGMLICIAQRNNETFIPDGNFVTKEGDTLSVITVSETAKPALSTLGVVSSRVKNAAIVGGGDIAFYLANMLKRIGIKTKIIEENKAECERLSEMLPDTTIIEGDGMSRDLYKEEHIGLCDAIIAAMGSDEENIIFSMYAKSSSKAKVITKLTNTDYDEITKSLEIDSVINPLNIAAESILRFVRGLNNSLGYSEVEALYRIGGGAVEAIEFKITEESEVTGNALKDMNIKKNTLVAAISRDGQLIIPGGLDSFAVGDSVIIVTTNRGYQDLDDILEN